MLFELAKLAQEVKHLNYEVKELRRMMETTASGTVSAEKIDVPEIDKGPITTLEEFETFMNRCGNKDVKLYLVSILYK